MKRMLFALALAACSKSTAPAPAEPATPEPSNQNEVPATDSTPPVEPAKPVEPPPPPAPLRAKVELAPASKSNVRGTATFLEVDGGVEITANLEGLKPGEHGWHVHANGDCSAPDASSAGDHFNPDNHKHGAPEADERHAGDFGNLTAGKDGKATKTITMKGASLADGAGSLVGKALIIHDKKDDLKTQPSGNAGPRVACGVIQKE